MTTTSSFFWRWFGISVLASAAVALLPVTAGAGVTTRVSVHSDGTQGDDWSGWAALNADGRYVAFDSTATTLVDGDDNDTSDVFVHDRDSGVTTRVSVRSDGTQGDAWSGWPALSADGRYVAFHSEAENLVDGDDNGIMDIFVHDRDTGITTRVSVHSDGTQGDDASSHPAISADGRYVVFQSHATTLVDGDDNGERDVFVHDRDTGTTTRVSVHSNGTQGDGTSGSGRPSADGRYVAFDSAATTLVDGDDNGEYDVFVHDRDAGTTTLVSVHSGGTQGDGGSGTPSISGDGRYVAFDSTATTLVDGDDNDSWDCFVHDRDTGITTRVSVHSDGTQGDRTSWWPSISADGRYVAFDSAATTLADGDVNGERDVFVHDRDTGTTTLVSVHSDGTQGDDTSGWPAISADGRYVAFDSLATTLVDGDDNGQQDVFVHDRGPGGSGLEGDLDGDGDVDSDDVAIIVAARGQPATGPDDPRDLDGDGVITALDARLLVLQCTRPYCATG
jgi:Tol biopolymer transport system component